MGLKEVRGIHASCSGKFMLYSKTLRRQESVACSFVFITLGVCIIKIFRGGGQGW